LNDDSIDSCVDLQVRRALRRIAESRLEKNASSD
jgi:hypothetical protein